PRLGGNARIGVLATRAPQRPNPIGLSVVRLVRIEGLVLHIDGCDLADGTPVLDLKPYVAGCDRVDDSSVAWLAATDERRLAVEWSDEARAQLDGRPQLASLVSELEQVLALDPRPSYHDDGRSYAMTFAGVDVRFRVDDMRLVITGLEPMKTPATREG
ncbi:MAG TPA: tRNA (N6-threonylcarbamoyladenosine(37)-N6)-methyltransferase TrmO, partial [Nannocystaceae bacterium]|nr:tRNA (N6-threonylcarbamoyladenosine(37)-N6)-methyltransferase TrmO [Nannocystaceae bacterium]